MFIPTLQMGKLRYREAQQATQEDSSRGWQLMIQGLPNLGGAGLTGVV